MVEVDGYGDGGGAGGFGGGGGEDGGAVGLGPGEEEEHGGGAFGGGGSDGCEDAFEVVLRGRGLVGWGRGGWNFERGGRGGVESIGSNNWNRMVSAEEDRHATIKTLQRKAHHTNTWYGVTTLRRLRKHDVCFILAKIVLHLLRWRSVRHGVSPSSGLWLAEAIATCPTFLNGDWGGGGPCARTL